MEQSREYVIQYGATRCSHGDGWTLTERRAKEYARGEGVRTHATEAANRLRGSRAPPLLNSAPRSPSPQNRCPILH
ncbi:unnamed protein product [Leptosia nina]|uniref:Uncharacterized protein n=1 Tax=Leptosia nina TaxID=320188 RepID=A0AAV1JIV7_9NEOP